MGLLGKAGVRTAARSARADYATVTYGTVGCRSCAACRLSPMRRPRGGERGSRCRCGSGTINRGAVMDAPRSAVG